MNTKNTIPKRVGSVSNSNKGSFVYRRPSTVQKPSSQRRLVLSRGFQQQQQNMGVCMVFVHGSEDAEKILSDMMMVNRDDTNVDDEDDAMSCICSHDHDLDVHASTFEAPRYFETLQKYRQDSRQTPTVLITASTTASTQSSLQKRAGRLVHGTVFVADVQKGGRGRGGNIWESPDGCLMFSMSLTYPGDGKTLPFVQYIVSLAIVDTIKSLVHRAETHEPFPIRIKWPNDIYYYDDCSNTENTQQQQPIKIGGILCHSSYRDSSFCMTVGVGINVANSNPTTCLNDIFGNDAEIRREDVVAGIVYRVESMLPQLAANGFDQFKQAYYDAWLHSGQAVSVKDGDMFVSVNITGLTEQGYLLAIGQHGEQYELCPDGNSLDFFHGLIVSKKS